MDHDERMVMQVALYEYINARRQPDIRGYVNKRYPADMGYSEQFRADKRESVAKNIEVAERLRKQTFTSQ